MESVLQDVRYAVRVLLRNPAFALVAVLTLSLGIGLTTSVFTLLNALVLRPLPVARPAELVTMAEVYEQGFNGTQFSYDRYRAYRDEAKVFTTGVVAAGATEFHVVPTQGAQPGVVLGSFVSGNYFGTLGIAPARGRFFSPVEDEVPGANPIAVISFDYWQRQFGGNPGVIGQSVTVNGQPLTVVGIAPRGFGGTTVAIASDLWIPLSMYAQLNGEGTTKAMGADENGVQMWLVLFGRLKPGTSMEQAQSTLSSLARSLPHEGRRRSTVDHVEVERLSGLPADLRGGILGFIALLMVTAGLVLLIAAVNVAGMLLARAAARQREIAIRLAMGAQRVRLIRQLLTEGLVLSVLGCAGGILLAVWVSRVLATFQPSGAVRISLDLSLDRRVLGFAIFLSLLVGIGFALFPALQASRPDLVPVLKNGSSGGGKHRSRLRRGFVVGQVTASLLLLVVAGLFIRALQTALSTDPGFDPDGVMLATIDVAPHGYNEQRSLELYRQLMERVRALPGVTSAGLSSSVPLSPNFDVVGLRAQGYDPADGTPAQADYNVVDDHYFTTLRIPLVAGRTFNDQDRTETIPVVVVNEALARLVWPGESALGKWVMFNGKKTVVVGVARNSKYHQMNEPPQPHLFLPFSQHPQPRVVLHVKVNGNPGNTVAGLRQAVQELDRSIPVSGVVPLSQRISNSLLPQRVGAGLLGVFGGFGLLLAAIGLYGILAYSVSQRTYEIGVRLALGAQAGDVLRMIVRQGMGMVLIGGAVGLVLSLVATKLLSGVVYGISSVDLLTYGAVLVLLGAVALLASYLPARRAAQVNPMLALRSE
ncbi:MAG: ABC transporter permease [Gemmatimonadetes bacterium]|nr:ABC transporter permease [Gemmatimonadota bacterium]